MAGSSYELDGDQSIQSKFFSLHILDLLMEGIRAFQIPFLRLVIKKDTYDIFTSRLLKTK